MNCIIVEDDILSQQTLVRSCKMYGEDLSILGVFDSVEKAEEFIKSSPNKIDLIFLDIILPGKNGIDFISDLLFMPYIIMTTSYDSFAVQAFELNVVDYLKKPFVYKRFVQSIQKVKKLIKIDQEKGSSETIVLKSKGSIVKFFIKDIDYVESYSDYIKIHTKNDSYLYLSSLKEITQRLPSNKFIQIHRKYIINIDKIIGISENKISLEGYPDVELPISRAQRKGFYQQFIDNPES